MQFFEESDAFCIKVMHQMRQMMPKMHQTASNATGSSESMAQFGV
jgi:hypothetical protein